MSGNERFALGLAILVAAASAACTSSPDDFVVDDGGEDATGDSSVSDGVAPSDAGDGAVDGAVGTDVGDTGSGSDTPADTGPTTTPIVYVGLGNGNVARFDLDGASGTLTARGAPIAAGNYPSFLAFDTAHLRAFAVLEASDKAAAFSLTAGTGVLGPLGTATATGGPTHLAIDPTGSWLMTADYNAGAVDVFPVGGGGALGASTDRQSPGANTHQIVFDPSGKYVFVPAKGADLVAQYVFDAAKGKLTPNTPASVATAAKAGPRHLEFAPSGKFAYLIDELDSTMTALSFDATKGTLTPIQTLSTLPTGFDPKKNTAGEVHVAPSGAFVYGSNRGHDSIVAFSVDTASGRLTLASHTPTGGKTPRHFSLARSGTLLLVANQDSSNVVVFKATGSTLTSLATTSTASSPYWVGEIDVPR